MGAKKGGEKTLKGRVGTNCDANCVYVIFILQPSTATRNKGKSAEYQPVIHPFWEFGSVGRKKGTRGGNKETNA